MTYSGYLYVISSDYTAMHGQRKLGCTLYPIHRMSTYNTGDAPGIGLEKRYEGVWMVSIQFKKDLLRLERHLHTRFNSTRQISQTTGKKTEWFVVEFDEVASFLNQQSYIIGQLTQEEIREIHMKSTTCNTQEPEYIEELAFMSEQCEECLKDTFFETFLPPGTLPRIIQDELWEIWENICENETCYKGIVQWPTGTGKTIGMMILLILSYSKCKREGRIFRALLISPKNDILDTIMHHIQKLAKWNILVLEGHHGRLSSMKIPHDKDILLTASHAALTDADIWTDLPEWTHIHYDEVHRITGEELFGRIQHMQTPYLTGTSATPETSAESQNKKIHELFGTNIIHRCNIEDAVSEGWIAHPRFSVHVIPNDMNRSKMITAFVSILFQSIQEKRKKGWGGGKIIAYLPRIQEVDMAIAAASVLQDCHIYSANDTASALKFVSDPADGTTRVLFACERFREGSDISGLEMTVIMMGNTIGSHVILQVAGRALRLDYPGKEGWCVIVRPSDEGVTEDDVFESIMMQIMEFVGANTSAEKIRRAIHIFFGTIDMKGRIYDLDESVTRIQNMYLRKEFIRTSHKEKYEVVRAKNRELGLRTKDEYFASRQEYMPDDPRVYFKDYWHSWYHFLGVDVSIYPATKAEWVAQCKDRGIQTWKEYKEKNFADLPENPIEMYEDYTNWDKEFCLCDEIVW